MLQLISVFVLLFHKCLATEDCLPGEEYKLTESMKQVMLDKHNEFRENPDKYGGPTACKMKKMVWDTNLEVIAQQWADHCTHEHGLPDTPDFRGIHGLVMPGHFGQNLWIFPGRPECDSLNPAQPVIDWFVKEVPFMSWDGDSTRFDEVCESHECKHLTQILWSDSCSVGCARGKCERSNYVVCQYYPAGNIKKHDMYEAETGKKNCPDHNAPCVKYDFTECKDIVPTGFCEKMAKEDLSCLQQEGDAKAQNDFLYMSKNCRKTCKLCTSMELGQGADEEETISCEDQIPTRRCRNFIRRRSNFCGTSYAKKNCRGSCQAIDPTICQEGGNHIPTCSDSMYQCLTFGAGESDLCVDPDPANLGDRHPAAEEQYFQDRVKSYMWMVDHCPQTCGICQSYRNEYQRDHS